MLLLQRAKAWFETNHKLEIVSGFIITQSNELPEQLQALSHDITSHAAMMLVTLLIYHEISPSSCITRNHLSSSFFADHEI